MVRADFPGKFGLNQGAGARALAETSDFAGRFQMPAVLFVRLTMHHSIRGQLTGYLRPMGAKVPSLYGESYDDAEARKAKAAQA